MPVVFGCCSPPQQSHPPTHYTPIDYTSSADLVICVLLPCTAQHPSLPTAQPVYMYVVVEHLRKHHEVRTLATRTHAHIHTFMPKLSSSGMLKGLLSNCFQAGELFISLQCILATVHAERIAIGCSSENKRKRSLLQNSVTSCMTAAHTPHASSHQTHIAMQLKCRQ